MSSYTINKTNGTTFVVIPDGAANYNSGLALLGQNFPNYGKLIAENFLHLLENQASNDPPTTPMTGQLWWDTGNKQLNYFDGERFKSCVSGTSGQYRPFGPGTGDLWWDTVAKRLKIYDNAEWLVVGPTLTNDTTSSPPAVDQLSVTPNGATTFISDAAYPYGTVLTLGGAKEVTVSLSRLHSHVVGVVHEHPIYNLPNGDLRVTVMVAGRTKCKVVGPVQKGDMLISSDIAGLAMSLPSLATAPRGSIIGMSLGNNIGAGVGSVDVLVGRF